MFFKRYFQRMSIQYRCYNFVREYEERTDRNNFILIDKAIQLLEAIEAYRIHYEVGFDYMSLSNVIVDVPHASLSELISEIEICNNHILEMREFYLPNKHKRERSLLSWFTLNTEVPHEKNPPYQTLLPTLVQFQSLINEEQLVYKSERLRRDLSDIADSLRTCVYAYYRTLN